MANVYIYSNWRLGFDFFDFTREDKLFIGCPFVFSILLFLDLQLAVGLIGDIVTGMQNLMMVCLRYWRDTHAIS
jgi:hypothetical protein